MAPSIGMKKARSGHAPERASSSGRLRGAADAFAAIGVGPSGAYLAFELMIASDTLEGVSA
jgi:hypothetical protein